MTEIKAIEILQSISNYINSNASKETQNGLYGGNSGLLLYGGYQSFFENGESTLNDDVFEVLVDKIFEDINNPTQSFFFSSGLTGELWAIYNLKHLGYIDVDEEVFSFYADIINQSLISISKLGLFDNLHGAFGILYYLNYSNTLHEDKLTDFLNIYIEKSYTNGEFAFYPTQANIQSEELSYNLSLSHGLSGQVLILSYVLKKHPDHTKLKALLNDMVQFILSYRCQSDSNSIFPSTLKDLKDVPPAEPKRLAWCYGDLGTGFALYRYASQIQDNELMSIAIKTLEVAAKGRGIKENRVLDAPLCHGASGVMQVFHRLYFETKKEIFKDAASHWFDEAIKFYEITNNIESMGAWRHDTSNFLANPGILEGYSGISLGILSKMNPEMEPSWDGCLFLS